MWQRARRNGPLSIFLSLYYLMGDEFQIADQPGSTRGIETGFLIFVIAFSAEHLPQMCEKSVSVITERDQRIAAMSKCDNNFYISNEKMGCQIHR